MIWFAHKRVCGVNARPFRFPLLSDHEYSRANEWLFEGLTTADGAVFTIAGKLQELCRVPAAAVPRTLELLRADASSLTFIQLLGSDMLAETLLFLRYTIYVHLGEICGMSNPTTPELCLFRPSDVPHGLWPELHDPHLALAFAARLLDHELDKPHLKPYPLDNDIYVQLCHHLLVFYTLLYRNARQSEKEEGTNSPSVAGAAARTLEELARLAKAQGDPRAGAVVAAIQPALQLAKLTGATWLFCSSGGPSPRSSSSL